MRILILGGTVFLGRLLVEAALDRGYQVTLFNRGQSNPGLFPQVENLRGDRKVDFTPLHGRAWDAAIDTSGYVPRVVRMAAEALKDTVGHYTYISSLPVYAHTRRPGIDEQEELGRLEDETIGEVTGKTYGPLKCGSQRRIPSQPGSSPSTTVKPSPPGFVSARSPRPGAPCWNGKPPGPSFTNGEPAFAVSARRSCLRTGAAITHHNTDSSYSPEIGRRSGNDVDPF